MNVTYLDINRRIVHPFKSIASAAILSMICAVFLELGTLIGSRLTSPFNLNDWSPFRLALFSGASFFIILLIKFGQQTGDLRKFRDVCKSMLKADSTYRWQTFLFAAVLSVFAFSLTAIPFALSGEAWDMRYGVITGGISVSVFLLYRFRKCFTTRFEYCFLILSLSFGTIACLCMPIIAEVSYDGQKHFRNAQAISFLENAEYSASDQIMSNAYAVEMLDLFKTGDLSALWNPKQDAESDANARATLNALGDDGIIVMSGTDHLEESSWMTIRAFGSIPNATGLWIGRLFHLPATITYCLGREASVIAYSIIFFLAIKHLRSGKMLVTAIGLLPAPLLMAANFSYDPWHFALLSYSFSRYASYLQRKSGDMTGYEAICIIGSFVLGVLVKAVLFPFALILIVVPEGGFASKRRQHLYQFAVFAATLLVIASFLIPYLESSDLFNPEVLSSSESLKSASASDENPLTNEGYSSQLSYVLNNPVSYIKTVAIFTLSFLSPHEMAGEANMLTSAPYLNLDYSETTWFFIFELFILIGLTMLDRSPADETYRNHRAKLSVVIGGASAYILIVTALYIDFTPIGLDTVYGVQYRYFLPFLVPICLYLGNLKKWKAFPNAKKMTTVVASLECAALTIMILLAFVAAF